MILPFLIFFIITLLIQRWIKLRKWDHLPGYSSISSIPLIGHGLKLGTDPIKAAFEMQHKFGNLFRCDFGGFPTVFLCDYETIDEAFKLDAFSGRPYHNVPLSVASHGGLDEDGNVCGVAITSGKTWKEQRHFFSTSLGIMRKTEFIAQTMREEATTFCENFKANLNIDGKAKNVKGTDIYSVISNNIIWRTLTGSRRKQTSTEVIDLSNRLRDFMKSFEPGGIVNMLSTNNRFFLHFLTWIGVKTGLSAMKPMKKIIDNAIQSSRKDPSGTLIDRYLAYIDQNINEGKSYSVFRSESQGKKQLFGGLVDILIAGTDTASIFMEWCVLYMMKYPEVQEKVFEEIKSNIGLDRYTTLCDKKSTPYCEAVIEEVSRICPEVYFSVPHFTTEDVTFKGVFYPKDTQVISFTGAVCRDERYFPNPEVFQPERFLGPDGNFIPSKHNLFFGSGRHRCPGEFFAKDEIYLFFTTLFQMYQFSIPLGHKFNFASIPGIGFYPFPYEMDVSLRQ